MSGLACTGPDKRGRAKRAPRAPVALVPPPLITRVPDSSPSDELRKAAAGARELMLASLPDAGVPPVAPVSSDEEDEDNR